MKSGTTEPNKNSYLLLSHTAEWYRQLSHAELQQLIADNHAWVERLIAEKLARPGVALARQGAIVSGDKRVIVDGPYMESKEAIGGTLILDVATLEEAIEIAKACPSLRHNSKIEIRPIIDECPLEACVREKEQLAAAAA